MVIGHYNKSEKEPGLKPVWGMFTCVSMHRVVMLRLEKFNYPLYSLFFLFFSPFFTEYLCGLEFVNQKTS